MCPVDIRYVSRNVPAIRVYRESPSLILSEKYRSLCTKGGSFKARGDRVPSDIPERARVIPVVDRYFEIVCLERKVNRCVYIALVIPDTRWDRSRIVRANVSIGECSFRDSSGKLM